MAEEQKTVEVPQDVKVDEPLPVVPVVESAKEETPVATEEATKTEETAADKPAEETKTEEAKEEAKEEVKPIEEGQLGHKAQGASFPKNLIPSKEFFFFGSDAYEPKALTGYLKNEKSLPTYHANVAWASETGKGLLFTGDKKAPTGIINLSDASEPETEGANKFTLTSKGNKHSFKAANAAERDNWVAQLKLKIVEAKELATTVVETETYKKTLESFKPAKKEEKPAVAAAATEAPKEEADKPAEETAAATEEAPKEEAAKEEKPAEEAKPLKNKRASFFGFMNKKDEVKPAEEKKEEDKTEEVKPEEAAGAAEIKPAEEAPAATEEAKPEEAEAAKEDKPAESPKEKASKRNSFFGGILSKKEKKVAEAKPTETTEAAKEEEAAPVTETAPVIPPVEATTPLAAADVTEETKPTETTEAAAATNGEAKKDVKEKRKSSLPFLGKREKSPAPSEGEQKSSAFSKLRATIKGKSAPKAAAEEKPAEEAAKDETKAEETKADEVKPEEAAGAAEIKPAEETPAAAAEPEAEVKPENVATATPAVTAAA